MSQIVFELKDVHIKLLSNLAIRLKVGAYKFNSAWYHEDEEASLLVNIYDEMDLILNGVPSTQPPPDLETEPYSEGQKEVWDKLLEELPIALDIILYTNSFALGKYTSNYQFRFWKKVIE